MLNREARPRQLFSSAMGLHMYDLIMLQAYYFTVGLETLNQLRNGTSARCSGHVNKSQLNMGWPLDAAPRCHKHNQRKVDGGFKGVAWDTVSLYNYLMCNDTTTVIYIYLNMFIFI